MVAVELAWAYHLPHGTFSRQLRRVLYFFSARAAV